MNMQLPEKIFIRDLSEGEIIDTVFRVVNKELRPKKNDGKFLRLILADKTGEIICNMWDNFQNIFNSFQIDDYLRVKAQVKMFQQKLQLQLINIKKIDSDLVVPEDFHKSSPKNKEDMWDEFNALIESMDNQHLKTLLLNIFTETETMEKFKNSPAAKALHHSYQSGLLEHTLSLAKLADRVAEHYASLKINRDLLLTGAMLHDIGKIEELSYDKSYNYTDEGRLLGHITIEAIRVEKEIDKIDDFPDELRLQLLHIILSHHGVYEFGSPKRPKTLEALILYYLDDMDAKIESMYSFIVENAAAGKWAGFESRQFERFIYKGSLYEESEE